MPITPELADVILNAVEDRLTAVFTAMPGRVTSYDAATQKADVLPLVGDSHKDEDGARVPEAMPIIPDVPVQFPGGGGMRITFPLKPGDTGLLVFCNCSLDRWLVGNGDAVDPADDRRHHPSDAVFIPGIKPFGAPWGSAPADNMSIGNDAGDAVITITPTEIQAGGTSPLALKSDVDALKNALLAHVHLVPGAATGGPGITTAATTTTVTVNGTDVLKGG